MHYTLFSTIMHIPLFSATYEASPCRRISIELTCRVAAIVHTHSRSEWDDDTQPKTIEYVSRFFRLAVTSLAWIPSPLSLHNLLPRVHSGIPTVLPTSTSSVGKTTPRDHLRTTDAIRSLTLTLHALQPQALCTCDESSPVPCLPSITFG